MSTVQISEMEINDAFIKLKIAGPKTHEEARSIVEQWCDTHNCVLEHISPENGIGDSGNLYFAKVSSDDYM